MRFALFLVLLPTVALAQTKPKAQPQPKAPPQPKSYDTNYPLDLSKVPLALPDTYDTELRRVLTSQKTIFYKLPSVWQHYIPSSRIELTNLTLGTKSYTNTKMVWGIYFSSFNSDFNANPLFPWETTAGLNDSRKQTENIYKTINILSLPEDDKGNIIPILVLNETPIKWIFPEGTTVGEVIYVVHDGTNYVQEVRTRKKETGSMEWTPSLYRPVSDRKEFMSIAGIANYTPAQKYMFLRNPQEDEVFKMEGLVERLPPVSDTIVKRLLDRPFKDVTDKNWSPCSDQDFHILPKNYCFSLLESVDSVSCSNCHRQTQISVLNLVPKEPLIINNPEKVGNIRGCDAVFTWHPFSGASVRASDDDPLPEKTSLRDYDWKNGIVKVWHRGMPVDRYKLTEFVQRSLKSYELPPSTFLHKEPSSGVEPSR